MQIKRKRRIVFSIITAICVIILIAASSIPNKIMKKLFGDKNSAQPLTESLMIDVEDDPSWNAESCRTFLWYKTSGSFGGVEQKNQIHVFAYEGDTICVGSNVYNSNLNLEGTKQIDSTKHPDEGSYDVVMHNLKDELIPIDIRGVPGSDGYINSPAVEKLAKTMTSPKGNSDSEGNTYVPYTYIVQETGVYTFEFRSYSGTSSSANDSKIDISKQNQWLDPSKQGGFVAAWDITVFNEKNEKETGRTYADYLAFNMVGNMREKYYVMTNDNYIYEMKFNDIRPWTFSFFANNIGITDNSNGNIVYKSVKDLRNDNQYAKFGVNYNYPTTDDTDFDKNFYIFFEKPNDDLNGQMFEKAIIPDPATNVKFSGEKMYAGNGGYFSFDVQEATNATLRIDFNILGEDYAPIEISDVVKPYSTNYFYWNGKDGKGREIPAKKYTADEIKYSVITKAGEIHFPLIDIEDTVDGITFTRINKIYNKQGDRLDGPNTIYDKTRNIIYYDDTAIYYGEKITDLGASEASITYEAKQNGVTYDKPVPRTIKDKDSTPIAALRNIGCKTGSEYIAYTSYGKDHDLRVGDHSSLSNRIDYSGDYSSQSAVITYLDSKVNPVAKSPTSNYVTASDMGAITGTGGNYNTTTDYGIANYWTFVNSNPVGPDDYDGMEILSPDKKLFNLNARVFYDEDPANGQYHKQEDGDHLLENVTLNLYKKTFDVNADSRKQYVYVNDTGKEKTIEEVKNFEDVAGKTIYELVQTAVTPFQGTYMFTGLEYDETEGTEYLYQVIKPNNSFKLTSGEMDAEHSKIPIKVTIRELNEENSTVKPQPYTYNVDIYEIYAYDKKSKGTEIQMFTVGGDGIDLTDYPNNTATTIDVGYEYTREPYELKIKKTWEIGEVEKEIPESAVFEVCYNTADGPFVFQEYALSAILSWNNSYKYLETAIEGKDVTDWFVSAEYYIYKDKIFRHKFNYDAEKSRYETLSCENAYFSLSEYYKETGSPKPDGYTYTQNDIPDFNRDGKGDWNDLKDIPEQKPDEPNSVERWRTALAAGFEERPGVVVAPFSSVIDRNVGTATTEINITNASDPGTIEILKYTGELKEGNYLSGATFRIYKGEMSAVKEIIEKYDSAYRAFNNASDDDNKEELQQKLKEASDEVDKIQIASSTTRINGRIAFTGLNPNTTYTIRERFAPSGYRISEEYYQVNSKNTEDVRNKFNENGYYQLNVGNIEATGDLGIRKMIYGRAWNSNDKFSFNVQFTQDDIVTTPSEQELYNKNGQDLNELVTDFMNSFNNEEKDIVITNDSPFVPTSTDTKAFTDILETGIPEGEELTAKPASLLGVTFPSAGTYTFTIVENADELSDTTLKPSPRRFTITIDISRVLDKGIEDVEADLTNSHLEANVSKIIMQELTEEGTYGESSTFPGNNPVFINEYVVQDVAQHVGYSVTKSLKGRANNKWLPGDEFTFTLTGNNEETLNAMKENKIKITGKDLVANEDNSVYSFKISQDTPDYKFVFDEIDFNDIRFTVQENEDGTITTQPIEYYLDIKEDVPIGATDNVYNGIKYTNDTYTLKAILENSATTKGETDGIVDKITFELYKNYDYREGAVNKYLGQCVINQTKDPATGEIRKSEKHDTSANSHNMVFENRYEVNLELAKIWEDNYNTPNKRPTNIKLKLNATSIGGYKKSYEETLSSMDQDHDYSEAGKEKWARDLEVPLYDDNGNEIIYTLEEVPIKPTDLKFYTSTRGKLTKVDTEENSYKMEVLNTFNVPEDNVTIEMKKIWDDNGDAAGKRPESVTLKLTGDEKEYTKELTEADKDPDYVGENNEEMWVTNIEVPMYDKNGDEIEYELSEEPTGNIFYTAEKAVIDQDEKTVTNKFIVPNETVSVPVTKVWQDESDYNAQRPTDIILVLLANGTEDRTHVLNASEQLDMDRWQHTFTDLPKYDKNGDIINYSVTEREKNPKDLQYYHPETTGTSPTDGITITNVISYAKVTVHHYIVDTREQVPSKEGGKVPDDIIEGSIGSHYDTSASDKIALNYECVDVDGSQSGNMTKDPIEVTYYYKLKDPTIKSEMEKKGPSVILTKTERNQYTLKYTANLKDYIGNATITIVDKLPYHIDNSASKTENGNYNPSDMTLTWTQEIKGINTFEEEKNEITFTKNIELVYTDIEDDAKEIVNKVTGTINLDTPSKTDTANAETKAKTDLVVDVSVKKVWEDSSNKFGKQPNAIDIELSGKGIENKVIELNADNEWKHTFENLPKYDSEKNVITYSVKEKAKNENDLKYYKTKITNNGENEITVTNTLNYGKVIVHHYLINSDQKVPAKDGGEVPDEVIEGNVGDKYTTKASENIPVNYELATTKGQTDGEMLEGEHEVIYYYRLKNPLLITPVIVKEATPEMTDKADEMEYTIKFLTVVVDYIGDGLITIVDTLPYEIDVDKSELQDGKYDAENKTITWTKELKDINSFEKKNDVINMTKEIKLVYKNVELTEDKITNNVKGTLTLKETDSKFEVTDSASTDINVKGDVIVKYIDKATGKEISKQVKKTGKIGTTFDISNDKIENIDGYTLIKEPDEKTGKYTESKQEKVYYYAKNSSISVKYVDKKSDKEIETREIIDGYEGKKYESKAKEIQGYDLLEEPKNKDGTMKREPKEIVYYYIKKVKVVVKYVEKDTNIKLDEEKIEGHEDDKYTTEQKDIKFYKLLEKPENASGTMKIARKGDKGQEIVDDTIYVTYYYRKLVFNLGIDEKIDKIIVNGKTIDVNGDLSKSKVELYRKEIESNTLQVVYSIVVKNTEELSGNALIRENIPTGMKMLKDKNPGWTIKGNSATLQTENIDAGKEKEYKIYLEWTPSGENLGQITNRVEIIRTHNEAEFADKDVVDNSAAVDLIIAIETGNEMIFEIVVVVGVVAVLLAGLIIRQKRKNNSKI